MSSDTSSGRAASDATETGTVPATPAPLPKAAMETGEGGNAESVDSPEPSGPDTSDSSLAAERGTFLHDFLFEMEDDNVQNDELARILDGLTEQQLNQPDGDGQTPLHIAASRGLLGATKHLLDKGVGDSIEHKDLMGRQPLHCACKSGQKEIVHLLLALGADLEAKGPSGRTPLGEACYWENLDVMNELLAHRAKVNVVDEDNCSLLTWAVIKSNIDIVKRLLLEEHLDLNNREDAFGWTALHRAAYLQVSRS